MFSSLNKVMIRETPDVIGYDCSIHTLQLSIADLFKNKLCTSTIEEASRKCHELAVFVGRSGQRIDDLREACKRTNTKFLKLQKANATRYNSKYTCMFRITEMKVPLQFLGNNYDIWRNAIPTPDEFRTIGAAVIVLAEYLKTTKCWESDTKPTIHNVVTQVWNLKDHLRRIRGNGDDSNVQIMAQNLCQLTEERFPNSGTNNLFNRISHYLDPASKGVILHEFGKYDSTKKEIVDLSKRFKPAEDPNIEPAEIVENLDDDEEEMSGLERLLKKRRLSGDVSVRDMNSSQPDVDIELQNYESLPVSISM